MTNPYASPQASSGPPGSTRLPDDSKLDRRSAGARVCGVLAGALAALIGAPLILLGLASADPVEWFVIALAGATLVGLGSLAALGARWALYAIATLAAVGLTFLAIELWFVLSIEETARRNAILVIRVFVATPALLILAVALVGMAFDVAWRRRRAELVQPESHVEVTR